VRDEPLDFVSVFFDEQFAGSLAVDVRYRFSVRAITAKLKSDISVGHRIGIDGIREIVDRVDRPNNFGVARAAACFGHSLASSNSSIRISFLLSFF
jgi:hypothetical protein